MVAALDPGVAPDVMIQESPVPSSRVRLLAVGDINLGRNVGQEILAGNTGFPFEYVADELHSYDLVIGNLECQLSDQQGETQHPLNNLIFTGPPSGAISLRLGGIAAVSTANNHAFDYGVSALRETMKYLNEEQIIFAGTAESEEDLYSPTLFSVNGVTFAFFACTGIMNIEDRIWTRYVAEADSGRLFPALRSVRPVVDIVILSFHGGAEYAAGPSPSTEEFARASVDAGVDLFLGHHPHVPQRIEQRGGSLIVYSLGNFVFRQPFDFWTQRSFALEVVIAKNGADANLHWFHPRPVAAGDQPSFEVSPEDFGRLYERIAGTFYMKEGDLEWFN